MPRAPPIRSAPEHYRAWSFPAFRYSDLIWLYLRDELDRRPLPYIDYPLEYPPLTGLVSWLLSWSPDLPVYFALAYALLAASALLAVWALQHVNGANVWLFAASPALFFYTGHQWDMAAIGITALAVLALQRGREGWGIAGLVIATSLKLFPVVFVAAAVVERIRDRRYRSAAGMSLAFAAGTLAINLPVALLNFEGWSFFFRWNRDRLADSGIWVLWRGVPTEDLTRWSAVAALAGGIALSALVFRSRGPIMIPLGATYLLWWLLVNKTFTTHLMLWAFLSLALLSAPWWLWGLTTATDLAGFQLGNYLNLYNVSDYQNAPLIRKAVENIYDPMQIARSVVLLVSVLWGMHVLQMERLRASTPQSDMPLYPGETSKNLWHSRLRFGCDPRDRSCRALQPRHWWRRELVGAPHSRCPGTDVGRRDPPSRSGGHPGFRRRDGAHDLAVRAIPRQRHDRRLRPVSADLALGMDSACARDGPPPALPGQHLLPVRADAGLYRRQRARRPARRPAPVPDRRPAAHELAPGVGDVRGRRHRRLCPDRSISPGTAAPPSSRALPTPFFPIAWSTSGI